VFFGREELAVLLTTVSSNWLRLSVLFPLSNIERHFSTSETKTECKPEEHFANQPAGNVANLSNSRHKIFVFKVCGTMSRITITVLMCI
jgi:hypothetical protein